MKKILGLMLLILCLAAAPLPVCAGGIHSVPSVTVSMKETGTLKHRTVAAGVSLRILAKVGECELGSRSLCYRSSDSSVAAVDRRGVVSTKAEGEVSIWIAARDGSRKAVLRLSVREDLYGKRSLDHLKLTGTAGELAATL